MRPPSLLSVPSEEAALPAAPETLAEAVRLLQGPGLEERLQRACVLAIGRLAKDATQLRPLCLASTVAVAEVAGKELKNLPMQRLATSALGSIAYTRDVVPLIVGDALPPLLGAMIAHPEDSKLQALGCEALARLALGGGEVAVLKACVQAALQQDGALEPCCRALARLEGNGLFGGAQILDIILALAESSPSSLSLQRRASEALRALTASGAVEDSSAKARAGLLVSAQWGHLLARFEAAADQEELLNSRFHCDVQELFHEEVARHFEYEAAERSLHLLEQGAPGPLRLKEVIRCYAENLEDYRSRLEAREMAWDPEANSLAPLDSSLRVRLRHCVEAAIEPGLEAALREACVDGPVAEATLRRRTKELRAECSALLERKTEATQVHQERATELRREVMLFEAVDLLEGLKSESCVLPVRTALHMLEEAAATAPLDAMERLQERLGRLAAFHGA